MGLSIKIALIFFSSFFHLLLIWSSSSERTFFTKQKKMHPYGGMHQYTFSQSACPRFMKVRNAWNLLFFLFIFFGGKMGIFLYVLVVLRADVAFFFGRTVIDVGVSPDRPTDVRFPSSRTLLYRWYARVFRSMNSKLWTETRLTWSCTCAATG